MSGKAASLRLLEDRRNQLRAELGTVKARLDEVESLIQVMGGVAVPQTTTSEPTIVIPGRTRRGDLNNIVLSLCEQAGEAGLSSAECVEKASKAGAALKPASVSSLLSRLKADGVLMYDGERYRLKRFAGPRNAVTGGAL